MGYVLITIAGAVALLLSAWVLVAGARKVLGVRVGTIRALFAAVAAWSVASLIGRQVPAVAEDRQQVVLLFIIPIFGGTLLVAVAILFVLEVIRPTGTGMWFVGGLRQIPGRLARARRYSRITRIALRHGLGPALRGRLRTGDPLRRAQLARSLREALEEAGVTFVKLGQVLSTRADLLTPEFVAELSKLQDQVAPAPREQVEQVLRDELGPPDEVFAEFDPTPLASASIAQVYRARLKNGTDAVVKVQRPGIRGVVERDLDIMYRLATTLEERTQWARRLGVVALADGFAKALLEELDFRVEAKNIGAVAADAAADTAAGTTVRIPVVHQHTERVLVMDRLAGVPLGAASAEIEQRGLDRTELARSLLHCLLRQVMRNGVFHADPHPGNVMLLTDGTLGLLDFGSVGRLDGSLRTGLQNLLVAVDRGDPAALRDGLLEVVDRPDDIDEQRLERALGQFLSRHFAGGAPDVEMFTDLFRLVTTYGLAVPPEIAAVFRALATMEGTLAGLAPGFNIVVESRSYAAARIREQMDPASLRKTATEELLSLLPVLRRLPRRIDRIGSALEEGRLSVNVRLLADERDRRLVGAVVHQVLLAFIGATTGIMSVLMLGAGGGPRVIDDITLYQVIGYNLLVISVLIGLRLLFAVFRGQRG